MPLRYWRIGAGCLLFVAAVIVERKLPNPDARLHFGLTMVYWILLFAGSYFLATPRPTCKGEGALKFRRRILTLGLFISMFVLMVLPSFGVHTYPWIEVALYVTLIVSAFSLAQKDHLHPPAPHDSEGRGGQGG